MSVASESSGMSAREDVGARRPWQWPGSILALPAVGYLTILFLIPGLFLISRSFEFSGAFPSLRNYERLFEVPVYLGILGSTLRLALYTTVLVVIAAYPAAYLLTACRQNVRALLLVLVLMPLWTSFVIRGFAWMVLLGREGAINKFLLWLGVIDEPLTLVFNSIGALVGTTHAMMPICVITMLSVMDGIDKNLVKAAGTLGASNSRAFWHVYLPLSLPGVTAGALLVFIISTGFFVTPALLGGASDTTIAQFIIIQIQTVLDWGFASAIAVMLLVAIMVIFAAFNMLFGLSNVPSMNSGGGTIKSSLGGGIARRIGYGVIDGLAAATDALGKAFGYLRPDRADKRRSSFGGAAISWIGGLVLAFVSLPALFVIPMSFTSVGYLAWPPSGFSLRWYEAVFANSHWWNAAARSATVAGMVAFLGLIIGTPAAFALIRHKFVGKSAVMAFLILPMMVPHIITALAVFYLFSRIGLAGTNTGLVLAHTILAIPYVVVTMMAVLRGYDFRLDQAAMTLGATRYKTLMRVTLPLLKGGLFAAFTLSFAISFDELTISLFVTAGAMRTLPAALWDSALLSVTPELTAIATMLLLAVIVVAVIPDLLRRTRRR